MKSKFGFLAKLNLPQDIVSFLIARTNPAITHNIEKYQIIKKVHYLSMIEHIEGDYLEFGVFTGSSFCHSIRCYNKLRYLWPESDMAFYGFDSFSGFGEIASEDEHPFYTDENFETSYKRVESRVRKVIKNEVRYKLIKGYFDESLKKGAGTFSIKKSKIIFIDSDTYSSANVALNFCIPTIQIGTFIILDDYYSYKGSLSKGVAKAFNEFLDNSKVSVRHIFNYGMGGVVFLVNELN